jgi:hypothetical protein
LGEVKEGVAEPKTPLGGLGVVGVINDGLDTRGKGRDISNVEGRFAVVITTSRALESTRIQVVNGGGNVKLLEEGSEVALGKSVRSSTPNHLRVVFV